MTSGYKQICRFEIYQLGTRSQRTKIRNERHWRREGKYTPNVGLESMNLAGLSEHRHYIIIVIVRQVNFSRNKRYLIVYSFNITLSLMHENKHASMALSLYVQQLCNIECMCWYYKWQCMWCEALFKSYLVGICVLGNLTQLHLLGIVCMVQSSVQCACMVEYCTWLACSLVCCSLNRGRRHVMCIAVCRLACSVL